MRICSDERISFYVCRATYVAVTVRLATKFRGTINFNAWSVVTALTWQRLHHLHEFTTPCTAIMQCRTWLMEIWKKLWVVFSEHSENRPRVILVLVWRNSFHFSRRCARKWSLYFRFQWPWLVSFWFQNYLYRVGQIKWHHFTFLLVTHECIHKILWFLAQINYIMQKMRWC